MKYVILAHHKCATTWLQQFIRGYTTTFGVTGEVTVYSNRPLFPDSEFVVHLNSEYHLCRDYRAYKIMHIIRDPRDMVVSAYYSHRNVHKIWPRLIPQRALLRKISKEAGMLATWLFLEREIFMTDFSDPRAICCGPLYALRSWDWATDEMIVRTEDIATNTDMICSQFNEFFECDVSGIVRMFTFDRLSGRKVGDIDNFSHFRCGLPGQWKDELEPSLAEALYFSYQGMIDKYYAK